MSPLAQLAVLRRPEVFSCNHGSSWREGDLTLGVYGSRQHGVHSQRPPASFLRIDNFMPLLLERPESTVQAK